MSSERTGDRGSSIQDKAAEAARARGAAPPEPRRDPAPATSRGPGTIEGKPIQADEHEGKPASDPAPADRPAPSSAPSPRPIRWKVSARRNEQNTGFRSYPVDTVLPPADADDRAVVEHYISEAKRAGGDPSVELRYSSPLSGQEIVLSFMGADPSDMDSDGWNGLRRHYCKLCHQMDNPQLWSDPEGRAVVPADFKLWRL